MIPKVSYRAVKKHTISVIKPSQLMLHTKEITVYYQIQEKTYRHGVSKRQRSIMLLLVV